MDVFGIGIVETEEDFGIMLRYGVDGFQGYGIGKPMPASQVYHLRMIDREQRHFLPSPAWVETRLRA
jgi:c-di-GMP-related signal transduction protein